MYKSLRLLALLLALICPATAMADLGILVPAYFYPVPNSPWEDLNTAASDVPIVAIMNPGSGPGFSQDSNYVDVVDNLQAAGGQVIGYVSTSYANRSLLDIQADIDKYASWYNVDGIFLDEYTNTNSASDLNFYESLYNYVKGIDPTWQVIGNPGTSTVEAYASRPTADVLVVHESFATSYSGYSPSAWNAGYPAENFAHLVHTQPSSIAMEANVDQAVAQNAGLVYVTDDVLGNPWDTLPVYWDDHVAKVKAINDGNGGVDPDPIKPGGLEVMTNPVANGSITVASGNTDRSDWAGIPGYGGDPADDAGPELDFLGVQVAHDDGSIFLRYDLDPSDSPPQPLGFRHNFFIDVDQDRTTGYIGSGGFLPIGVDYLLQAGTLYSFANGVNQETWGWNSVAGVDFDDTIPEDIELRLSRSLIGDPVAFDFIINGANDFISGTEDYYPDGGTAGEGGDYFTYSTIPFLMDGDFDGSGSVGQSDLNLVLLNWGLPGSTLPEGWVYDLPSGIIGQTELNKVLLNWGSGAERFGVGVPEPATLAGVMVGLAAYTRSRRKPVVRSESAR